MPENREKVSRYCRELTLPESLDEKNRSVDVVLSTETPVLMYDWDRGYVDEILVMSGVILPEDRTLALVDTHKYESIRNTLGSILNVKAENGELSGKAVISSTEDDIYTKVKEKHIRKLSIGYDVISSVIIEKGNSLVYEGKTYTAGERDLKLSTKWELYEGSFVTIPADNKTKIRSKENNMSEETTKTLPAVETRSQAEVDTEKRAAADVAVKIERLRASEIRTLGNAHSLDNDFVDKLINDGTSVDESRKLILDKIAVRTTVVPPKGANTGSSTTITEDETDKFRTGATLAIAHRAGIRLTQKENEDVTKSEFRGFSIQSLAREVLSRSGLRNVHRMTNLEIADKIIYGRAATTDFVEILANVMTKSISVFANVKPGSWRNFCGVGSLMDFKQADLINVSSFSLLDAVTENNAPTEGTFYDGKEVVTLETLAKKALLSRQMIINDDLRVFTSIGSMLGGAAERTINRKVYALLMSNPALVDTYAVFHAAQHGNLAATGSVPGVASIGAGLQAMMNQKDANSAPMNITPANIIVPPSLVVDTATFLNSISDYGNNDQPNANKANVFNSQNGNWKLGLTCDANLEDTNLTGYSTTAWYLASDPMSMPTITVFFLDGNQTPTIRSKVNDPGDALGIIYDVVFDAKAAFENYRGLYKNLGV